MNKNPLCLNLSLQMVCLWGMAEEFSLTILCELQHSFIDQVLNLIFQHPTTVSVISRTVWVVRTPCIWIVHWRGGVGILRRILQRNQLGLQHVLQCLSQWHVDFGKASFRCIPLMLITLFLLARLWRSSILERSTLHPTNFLSHQGMINDLIPNLDWLLHTVTSVLMKLTDVNPQLFLSPS